MERGQEEQGEKAASASNSRHEAAAGSPELLTRIRELETQLSDAYSAFSRLEKVCMGFEENIAHARAEKGLKPPEEFLAPFLQKAVDADVHHAPFLASDNLLLETVNKCLEAQIELTDRIDGRGHSDPGPDHVAVPQKDNKGSMDDDTERDGFLVRQLREKAGALQSSLARCQTDHVREVVTLRRQMEKDREMYAKNLSHLTSMLDRTRIEKYALQRRLSTTLND